MSIGRASLENSNYLKKLNSHYHATIAFLDIYPREMKTNGDTKSLYRKFIEFLFLIV